MITLGQLKQATCSTTEIATLFLEDINETLSKYQINTPIRQLCFLSQVGHESGGLFYTEELADGKAYERRIDLGNTNKGDGVKYKGRGLIQITGKANYQFLSDDLHYDFVENPTDLGGKNARRCNKIQLKYATLSAGWYWNKHHINEVADKIDLYKPMSHKSKNLLYYEIITKIINGGLNGFQDRVNRYVTGRPYFR